MTRIALALVAVLLLAACGDDSATQSTPDNPDSPAAPEEPEAPADEPGDEPMDEPGDEPGDEPAEGEATVMVASSSLGDILVDSEGRTLYLFDADADGEPTCYDDCAENWPALIADAPMAGEGVDASLDTVERQDGSLQVRANGQPLYFFAADTAPGDVNGQGVGDVWWVLSPEGEAIHDSAEVSAEVSSSSEY